MSQTKTLRAQKRQLGQFLTPPEIARRLISDVDFTPDDRVLEPSFGDGSFVLPLIEKFLPLYDGPLTHRLDQILSRNLYGAEIDPTLYAQCLARIEQRWGCCPARHNFRCADFFQAALPNHFDYIIGNPPFGGTLNPAIQDKLDRELGRRNGLKIKKETYAFFLVKCLDLLKPDGHLRFICSDTFLTINTMQGLRRLLLESGQPAVGRLDVFSDETKYAMVVLDFVKSGPAPGIVVDGQPLLRERIALTGNHSWQITEELAPYFAGPKLGDYVVATSGMTVGANDLFVREIVDGKIVEPYTFEFFQEPITLENEVKRARLGRIAPKKRADIIGQECRGETRRSVPNRSPGRTVGSLSAAPRLPPLQQSRPRPGLRPPTHAIFWKDEGDAVLTFKKNGNWYLRGVGGARFFGREGLTWQLISQTLNARWLPAGSVLDSGAPCAFLREGVGRDELWFILGWTFSPLCQTLLKEVINHTQNIQGKDFERLPYPFWVSPDVKQSVIAQAQALAASARAGRVFQRSAAEIVEIGSAFLPAKSA